VDARVGIACGDRDGGTGVATGQYFYAPAVDHAGLIRSPVVRLRDGQDRALGGYWPRIQFTVSGVVWADRMAGPGVSVVTGRNVQSFWSLQ
jgi:hypothetical protein